MNNFIGNNIRFIVEWGQPLMVGMIVSCLILIFLLVRKNRYYLPKGFFGYLATVVLLIFILFGSLIFMRIEKMKPGAMAILNQLESIKKETPSLNFKLTEGQADGSLDDFRGKVVLLNFWATWCAPCLKEMPDLNLLHEKYADKGLVVLAISDEPRERILKYENRFPPKLISGYVESFDWVDMGSERPVTFLINKNGDVEKYFTGAYNYEYFESQIEPFLK